VSRELRRWQDASVSAPRVRPFSPADRALVERLWQLYSHDLSEFRGTLPDAAGLYRAGRLTRYLDDQDRAVHIVEHEGRPAGFVMVRDLADGLRVLGEFFVVRAARRRGVGRAAALEVLRARPGRWEVAFQEENPSAARFWRQGAVEAGPHHEERRPVPDKPDLPPDTWLVLDVA
jgi:predicted acetyltransferase